MADDTSGVVRESAKRGVRIPELRSWLADRDRHAAASREPVRNIGDKRRVNRGAAEADEETLR
jgi:hypothetical protein